MANRAFCDPGIECPDNVQVSVGAYLGALLGADMSEIRARVLGSRMDAAQAAEMALDGNALTPDEHCEVYNELKRKHQVDLHVEANSIALEDPTLLAHIEAARRRLAEHERALLRFPRLEDYRSNYLKTLGQVSNCIRELEDLYKGERESVEVAFFLGRDIEMLLAGRKPHGLPVLGAAARADPAIREILTLLAARVSQIAQAYEKVINFVENTHQALFVHRREIEKFTDGLIGLVEATSEECSRLRELLALVAPRGAK